ncbi:MAG: decaprenyl-phosphate phosphoribosyltransferase [Flavobacteriales bacterium]|nr:decaprenyl-phosphate phosphoribosyltransferase [Flavobacteriales bacterium]
MHIIRLLRPQQWIKNLILFFPVFFAGKITDVGAIQWVLLGVLAFCLAASAVYILNDWMDREADKLHPVKRFRPIASGHVAAGQAVVTMILLAGSALTIAFMLDQTFLLILAGYLLLNISYTMGLKHVAVLDVSIVGLGFLIRILAGGVLADVEISRWIVLVSFVLALFLAIAKRREDVLLHQESGEVTRKSVTGYNLPYISGAIILMAAVVIVAYMMYTVSPEVIARTHSPHLYLTTILVIIGVLKYLQLTLVENKSGDPVRLLLGQPFLLVLVVAWLAIMYLMIYL